MNKKEEALTDKAAHSYQIMTIDAAQRKAKTEELRLSAA
jgi:hypothetical protein